MTRRRVQEVDRVRENGTTERVEQDFLLLLLLTDEQTEGGLRWWVQSQQVEHGCSIVLSV